MNLLDNTLSALIDDRRNAALISDRLELLESQGQQLMRRLRMQQDLQVELYLPCSTDALLARFNGILEAKPVNAARQALSIDDRHRLWVVHAAQGADLRDVQLLLRLIRDFPGAQIRLLMLLDTSSAAQLAAELDSLGFKMHRWLLDEPAAYQAHHLDEQRSALQNLIGRVRASQVGAAGEPQQQPAGADAVKRVAAQTALPPHPEQQGPRPRMPALAAFRQASLKVFARPQALALRCHVGLQAGWARIRSRSSAAPGDAGRLAQNPPTRAGQAPARGMVQGQAAGKAAGTAAHAAALRQPYIAPRVAQPKHEVVGQPSHKGLAITLGLLALGVASAVATYLHTPQDVLDKLSASAQHLAAGQWKAAGKAWIAPIGSGRQAELVEKVNARGEVVADAVSPSDRALHRLR